MGEATWRDYISIIILGPWFRTCHFESRNCALKDLNTHWGKLDNGKKSIWNIIIWRKPKFLALSWNHLNTNHFLFRHFSKSFNSAWKEVLSSFNICFQGNLSLALPALPAPFRNCSMLCFLFSVFFLCNIHFESMPFLSATTTFPRFWILHDWIIIMSHASWLKDENMCNLKFSSSSEFWHEWRIIW